MDNLLKILEQHALYVHEIVEGYKLPFHANNWDTHYVMKGSSIIFHGNMSALKAFVLRYHTLPKVKS